MKNFSRLVFGIMLAAALLMNYSPLNAAAAGSMDSSNLKWQSTAFGQSTDLNFSSGVLPEKVGVNGAIPEFPGTINGKIVIESRGGKIAESGHDGLAFYYTVLDPRKYNFILEADVVVEQFGPETKAMPNRQTACGLMVRDVNGPARQNPMIPGFEELPAASNIAATGLFSTDKTALEAWSVVRSGIFHPWGNPDSTYNTSTFKKDIPVGTPFKLKLERTDTGFIMTYADLDGSNAVSKEVPGADIVQTIEKDKMYVGFFAARNAKMVITNAKLTVSPANTKPSKPYAVKQVPQFFEIESSDGAGSDHYTLVSRSGYNGTVSVTKDGKAIVSGVKVQGGEFYKMNVTLENAATRFDIAFTPSEGPASVPITRTVTVEKRNLADSQTLIAAPNGSADAAGTLADPLDLASAIKFVQPGGTILLREGNYGEVQISRQYSGLEGKLKKLMPYNKEQVVFKGLYSQASYWHFYGLESANSKDHGFRTEDSGNILELCVSHDNMNSGFQLQSPVWLDSLKVSNNLYLNCEAYNNKDKAMKNADGFAAKTNVGKGTVYRGCISHNNIDDGFDLYNKIQEGANEPILIENCIAYKNGITTRGETAGGYIANGFKLGGEGIPVAHILRNSIAFENRMDGITCNFNPGAVVIENCTSFNNARYNFIFRYNPYFKPSGIFRNNISFRSDNSNSNRDFVLGSVFENNIFYTGKDAEVSDADFANTMPPGFYERNERGDIIWGDFLRLLPTSPLNTAGKNKTYLGALPAEK